MLINLKQLKILNRLYNYGPLSVKDISLYIGLSQPYTSKLLSELKVQDFVVYEKFGIHIKYNVNPKVHSVVYYLSQALNCLEIFKKEKKNG